MSEGQGQGQVEIRPASLPKNGSDDAEETKEEKKPEVKYNTKFKQQNLVHLRLNVSAACLASVAIVIGILFLPTGGVLIYSAGQARETTFDYTKHCPRENASLCPRQSQANFTNRPQNYCCSANFTLDIDFKGKVYIYYGLTKFHQNHRLLAKSRDDKQLYGGTDPPSKDCAPFDIDKNSTKPYWPCGALANTMFQDRLRFYSEQNGGLKEVQVQRSGIAWKSDISYKFKNPPGWKTHAFQQARAPPPNWRILPWELDNGLQNEDFIIWMRVAAFPEFRKIYGIVNGDLLKGNYRLDVEHNFDVKPFGGTKSIILATKAILGGKNSILGIAYLTFGVNFIVTGLFFLYVHINSLTS